MIYPFISCYLNLVRFASALGVVLFHIKVAAIGPPSALKFLPGWGLSFVTIFFVISGFVVSMVADKKTVANFAIDRFSRISILSVPVLLISLLLNLFLPEAADPYDTTAAPFKTFFLNLFFLGQSWSADYRPFLAGPYWSLCYEVMYYLLFACLFYFQGVWRWTLLLVGCLLAGPKILILAPCWAMGALAYKFRRGSISTGTSFIVAAAAPLMLAISFTLGVTEIANSVSRHFGPLFNSTMSTGFVRSWLVALAFSVHLWALSNVRLRPPPLLQKLARLLAGFSYSVYLTHFFVLWLLVYFLPTHSSLLFLCVCVFLVLGIAYLCSLLTERNTEAFKATIYSLLAIQIPRRSEAVDREPSDRRTGRELRAVWRRQPE